MTCCAHSKNVEQVHTARQTRFNVWRSTFGVWRSTFNVWRRPTSVACRAALSPDQPVSKASVGADKRQAGYYAPFSHYMGFVESLAGCPLRHRPTVRSGHVDREFRCTRPIAHKISQDLRAMQTSFFDPWRKKCSPERLVRRIICTSLLFCKGL